MIALAFVPALLLPLLYALQQLEQWALHAPSEPGPQGGPLDSGTGVRPALVGQFEDAR